MSDPKVHLSIDNCFASKRWVEPLEWMKISADIGIKYVEASADTECDPFYHGTDYLDRWFDKVTDASVLTGVGISSMYSGHGTYSTLGLAHTDDEVRKRFIEGWMKPMIRLAGRLDTSLGFFCHAFPESVLSDPYTYKYKRAELIDTFCELSVYAVECGCKTLSVEQMYSPHQIPWTIGQAQEIMTDVYERTGTGFYVTIDVGHMYGQKRFLLPDTDTLLDAARNGMISSKTCPGIWTAYTDLIDFLPDTKHEDELHRQIDLALSDMNRYEYMFSKVSDSDPYKWLSMLGGYSPTVHLQQTDGLSSSHLAFTEENNAKGIISASKIINSLQQFYNQEKSGGMPDLISDIYLTLEVFSSNGENTNEILTKVSESVKYWRQYIPVDGEKLSSLTK